MDKKSVHEIKDDGIKDDGENMGNIYFTWIQFQNTKGIVAL